MLVHSLVQPLGQPLASALVGARRSAAWSPRQLFADGEQGLAVDLRDALSLYQDAARTIPAGVGDPVGCPSDVSGNGNHPTQATATARSALQIDAAGHHYLDFDGVDDCYATMPIDLMHTSQATVVAATTTGAVAGMLLEFSENTNSADGSFYLVRTESSDGDISLGIRGEGNIQGRATDRYIATYPDVVTAMYDTDGGLDSALLIRANGESQTANPRGGITSSRAFGNHGLNIGARNGQSIFWPGKLYALIVIDRALTPDEIVLAEAWAAKCCGVTLP